MCKQFSKWVLTGLAGATLALSANQSPGQETPPVNLEAKEIVLQLVTEDSPEGKVLAFANLDVAAAPSEFWIGVSLEPLNDLLKNQLSVDQGLAVNAVYPDSPAEKAGLKVYDIVVKAGDSSVKEAGDLVKAVDAAKESALAVTVVRGGKEMVIKVTPAKRGAPMAQASRFEGIAGLPEAEQKKAMELYQQYMQKAMEALKSSGADGKPIDMLFFRPGIVGGEIERRLATRGADSGLPRDVSIQINKEGEQPAKITVTRDGKTWVVSEGKFEELPADLRPHVEGMLHAPGELRLHAFAPGAPMGRWLRVPEAAVPAVPAVPARPGSRVRIERSESNRSTTAGDGSLAELLEEVRQLRKEVQEMKAGKGAK
ncbi:MAG: PDZ domain-containing protein [Planctomycetes bacterium]|nr:PDZ domain-containing protein [Planctomycetota bacterium]